MCVLTLIRFSLSVEIGSEKFPIYRMNVYEKEIAIEFGTGLL